MVVKDEQKAKVSFSMFSADEGILKLLREEHA